MTQGQVAATIAAVLGEDYLSDLPKAAKPISEAIAPRANPSATPAAAPLSRIAFGSCATQARAQPIWDAVVATRPELTLLLGDNIYADTLDMNVMRTKYARLAAMPGFQLLRKTCPILATWDDHDLGANDAGGDYPKKDESQKVFLDFFGDPDDSPRRHRPGVYDAKVFGPEGKRVQVIMLDTRYFRSRLKTKEPYKTVIRTKATPTRRPRFWETPSGAGWASNFVYRQSCASWFPAFRSSPRTTALRNG